MVMGEFQDSGDIDTLGAFSHHLIPGISLFIESFFCFNYNEVFSPNIGSHGLHLQFRMYLRICQKSAVSSPLKDLPPLH